MSLRKFIWIACVINLGLIIGIVRQGGEISRSIEPLPTVKSGAKQAATSNPNPVSTTNSRVSTNSAGQTTPPFRWQQVESDDYLQLIANLRGIGCPDDTVRDIVLARVQDDFAEAAWEIQKPLQAGFWEMMARAEDLEELPIPKQIEDRLEKIQAERKETLAEVSKAFATEKKPYLLANSDRWSFLPTEQREQVRDLHEQIEQKRTELRAEFRAAEDPKEKENLRESLSGLNAARSEAIKSVIGEENWARYEATSSQSANWIRALPGLAATPEEMQQIAAARNALERGRKPRPRNATPEELDAHRTELDRINQRENKILTDVLGERASHVSRAADGDYLTMRNVARRHGLPMDIANRAYEVKQSVQTQLDALLAQDLNDERRLQATATLLLTVKSELSGIYGEQAWPSYQKYGMNWFEDLTKSAQKQEEQPSPKQPEP